MTLSLSRWVDGDIVIFTTDSLNRMGDFIVSARKYRPLRFSDVLGQSHVTKTLKNALKRDQLAHAFLFCGPRGVGKTSCARILAKVINCESPTSDFEPCNECSSCQSFNQNASFNIFEMDGASNNKVEHIHSLIEQVRFQPQSGRYKVFIIDEVHMLSQSAFNAFLKTLEEPPPYAIFILATTEKHKIIPTILSRCQVYDFHRIGIDDIVDQLKRICTDESVNADEDALRLIASKSDGSMRDALSVFDRIVSFSGSNVRFAEVLKSLNVLDYDYYFKFMEAFTSEDLPKVILLFDEVVKNGFEPDIFINGLADHLRQLLLCKDESTLPLIAGSEVLRERYGKQAMNISTSFIMTALALTNECDVQYPKAKNKRLHVEITLCKLVYSHRLVSSNPNQNDGEKKTSSRNVVPKKDEQTDSPESTQSDETTVQPDPSLESSTQSVDLDLSGISTLEDSVVNTPKLDIISDLEATIQQEEDQQNGSRKALTLEGVLEIWQNYISQSSSPVVKQILGNTQLSLDVKNIRAIVATQHAKNTILQETAVIEKIREHFHDNEITLQVDIDQSLVKASDIKKPKSLLTNKEKFEQLRKKNPLLDDFRRRFDLKLDND